MDKPRGLLANDLHDSRMSMAERIDSKATDKIQVLASSGVPQIHAFPFDQGQRIARVGLEQELALQFDQLLE